MKDERKEKWDRQWEILTDIGVIIVLILIISTLIYFPVRVICSNYEAKHEIPQQTEYLLSEMDDEYYAIYTKVVSRIQSGNYEIVTVNAKEKMLTLKGNVNIYYSEQKPKMIFKQYKYRECVIELYIPNNSVKIEQPISISH